MIKQSIAYNGNLTILKQGDSHIVTKSNLTLIKGSAGSGKSRLSMSLCAGFLGNKDISNDLEFITCPDDKFVIYISTEMSRHELQTRQKEVFNLIDPSMEKRFLVLDASEDVDIISEINELIKEYPAHVVIIDQLADLVSNINDMERAIKVGNSVHHLALNNDCPVIGMIHQNEDSDLSTKARGCFGSHLEQKACASIAIASRKDGLFKIISTKIRTGKDFSMIGEFNEKSNLLNLRLSEDRLSKNSRSSSIYSQLEINELTNISNIREQIGKITGLKSIDGRRAELKKLIDQGLLYEEKVGKEIIIKKVVNE